MAVIEKVAECNITRIKILQDTESVTSKNYKLKVLMSKNGKPEDFLQTIKDFKTTTDGTEPTSATGNIQFLRTILHRKNLREFDILSSQVGITTNGHLK